MRIIILALITASAFAAEGYTDTPLIPGQSWRVHDATRPQPRVIEPGAEPGAPPADAVVLFDGTDCAHWRSAWTIDGGALVAGGGDLVSKEEFGDCQLHIEWATPDPAQGGGQGRGNSGVFLMERYEVQVLDSFGSQTYADGQAGALYGQRPPLVNVCRPPGRWQVYDIVFRAPRFAGEAIREPALLTVLHNGVVLHHALAVLGPTAHRAAPQQQPHAAKAPIKLQDHGNPMRFRNIWVRALGDYDQP